MYSNSFFTEGPQFFSLYKCLSYILTDVIALCFMMKIICFCVGSNKFTGQQNSTYKLEHVGHLDIPYLNLSVEASTDLWF